MYTKCEIASGLAFTMLLLLSPLAQPDSGTLAEPEAAIVRATQQWIDRFKSGDLESLMTLYHEDAKVMLHGQSALRGRSAVADYFRAGLDGGRSSFQLDIEEIQVHGDVAHLISRYWFTKYPKDGGDPLLDAGRSLLIYKKVDGRWKIYADIDQQTPDATWPAPDGQQ